MTVLTLLSSVILSSFLHIGQLAEYKYSKTNDLIELEVTLEFAEVKQLKLDNSCDIEKTTAICLSNYILNHSTLNINNQEINFELTDSRITNGHIVLTHHSKAIVKTVTSVSTENTSFYEYLDEYKNRISFDLDTFRGSYILTKDKNSIRL